MLRVLSPTLLPVAVRATTTPFTQALQDAVRTELTKAFRTQPRQGPASQRNLNRFFSRGGACFMEPYPAPRNHATRRRDASRAG